MKGNVSGYVCNHGSPSGERDTASPGLWAMLRTQASDEEADDVSSRRHLYCGTPVVTSWAVAGQQVVFPFMGTRTASPRGRYGERPQRDSVWRYIWKNTTCWPATAHDVTTGVPQYKCRREDTSSAFSSSLTGLFEACRVNLVRVQFSNSTMASTSKAFRKCVDPCPRYLTPDDTHDCCVFCLGMEHARDVLEGAVCVRCERLSMRKLSSRLSLFSRKEGQPSASRDSRPTVAEARRRMKSWGSQLVVADKLERDRPLFARRPRTRVSCWIVMMRSFWHH